MDPSPIEIFDEISSNSLRPVANSKKNKKKIHFFLFFSSTFTIYAPWHNKTAIKKKQDCFVEEFSTLPFYNT
jgi:hypothetical protein